DTVTAHLSNNGIEFRANRSQVKFKGVMKVYVEGVDNKKQEDEGYLPELKEGDKVSAKDIKPNQHFTQPPPRYTQATLDGVLEKQGIARPSTLAPTLETIIRRGYVSLDKKRFVPTELGDMFHEVIQEYIPKITHLDYTDK